jgi:hypothetical protein
VTIGSASCTYEFAGAANADTSYTITATPKNIEAARDAWAALTDKANISVTEQDDDSYILIANGSKLQVGNQLLKFEDKYTDEFLKVDGFNNLSALNEKIRKAVELKPADSAISGITGILKSGSALAIGDDVATLNKSALITISGIETSELETRLTELQEADKNTKLTVKSLVNLFDALVGAVNGKSLKVEIEF